MKVKIIILLIIAVLVLFLVVNGGGKKEDETLNIGLAVSRSGINDKSFNQITWKGIEKFETYFNENDLESNYQKVEIEYLEAVDDLDQQSNLNALADRNDIVIASGWSFYDDIQIVAEVKPETDFIFVDGEIEGYDNLTTISFKEEEVGYLVGSIAALTTKTDKIAFIGGSDEPPVTAFGVGFVSGALSINENIEIFYEYANSYEDVALGRMMSSTMYDKGVDVIFVAAAAVGLGVIEEAKERTLNGEEVYVIGVDMDQYSEGIISELDDKSVILTSAMKKVDVVVFDTLMSYLNNDFIHQSKVYGIKEDGVGIPEENINLSNETLTYIEGLILEIENEKIEIPRTKEELEQINNYEF